MPQEIERKFLVKGGYKPFVTNAHRIIQGYLSSVPERTVRVRIKDGHGYLTIKGQVNESGASRYEWEKEITTKEANELLRLCESGIIDKTRHIIPADNNLFFEVDEFHGENEGLTVAEIELPDEDFTFEKPSWLGEEVTGDKRYYNSMLKKYPFKNWH
jgi:adenylate cyclase